MGGKKIDPAEASSLMIANGAKPLEEFITDKTNWKCECLKCGREIFPRYANVKNGHSPCKYCSGRRIDEAEAFRIMRENDLEPLEPYKNTRSKWKSICIVCGTEVQPILKSIISGQGGCLRCANHLVTSEDAVDAMRRMRWEPLVDYPGSASPWRCMCLDCGEISYPTHHKVSRAQGRRCLTCTKKGFNLREDGYLYLLVHPIWMLYKVGISNSSSSRTDDHQTRGWEVIQIKGPMDALLAFEWEKSILKFLTNKGAEIGSESIAGKFDGYTESWKIESHRVKNLDDLMSQVKNYENS